jgi:hypothetical protein
VDFESYFLMNRDGGCARLQCCRFDDRADRTPATTDRKKDLVGLHAVRRRELEPLPGVEALLANCGKPAPAFVKQRLKLTACTSSPGSTHRAPGRKRAVLPVPWPLTTASGAAASCLSLAHCMYTIANQ